jgi:hypothetical protein
VTNKGLVKVLTTRRRRDTEEEKKVFLPAVLRLCVRTIEEDVILTIHFHAIKLCRVGLAKIIIQDMIS